MVENEPKTMFFFYNLDILPLAFPTSSHSQFSFDKRNTQ